MGRDGVSILASSRTRQIIQKSKGLSLELLCGNAQSSLSCRIILASIKNLGKYPCPRCKVQMEHVPKMGEPEDRLARVETARLDNQTKRSAVESARALIYKDNLAVTNNKVEDLLSFGSLLPIDVRR